MPRYIVVQSHHTDQRFDWYIVDTATKACVDMYSGSYSQATDIADRLNREAH